MPLQIIPPPITKTDFDKVLARQRPTVSKSDLEVHDRFTKEFGEEGWRNWCIAGNCYTWSCHDLYSLLLVWKICDIHHRLFKRDVDILYPFRNCVSFSFACIYHCQDNIARIFGCMPFTILIAITLFTNCQHLLPFFYIVASPEMPNLLVEWWQWIVQKLVTSLFLWSA